MILRCSRFVHCLPLGEGRILIVHAVNHMRLPADHDVEIIFDFFSTPRRVPDDCEPLTKLLPYSRELIGRAVAGLVERQVLTDKSPDEEMEAIRAELAPTHGRDPGELLDLYRRKMKEGGETYWAAGATRGVSELGALTKRADVILFGDCDIQMESDFLRREAATRGIDLRVSATFPDDIRFASEHKHDAIIIGALRSRHSITGEPAPGQAAHQIYLAEAHRLLTQLREQSAAPILIDNLPEPTVQPQGLAEHGLLGHRTRFRLANVALAEHAAGMSGVYVVDIAAALGAVGSKTMLDDGLAGFTHFGAPGWLLQRPEAEKDAVHGLFPDIAPLAHLVGGDPYAREKALAITHVDALTTVLGIGRKKCVILDLDGTLWPGVLAETGSPFAWTPEISGAYSYIGLYFGLHEALLCLKKRGIVLACVSKNDEKTVRDLWTYPAHYPRHRLLTPDDFVTWRVNWNDKPDNIRSIADELGFALDSFIFIDDHPVERDRVRQRLPDVEVWGEDPFALRRRLLEDPRLQLPLITKEAADRGELVKAQLQRQQMQASAMNEADYIASLGIQCQMDRLEPGDPRLSRVEELFQRTTQFNTTGRKFSLGELNVLAASDTARVFVIQVSDRFADHGLVGAAVISDGEILGLAMSCRVLGMGVEHCFLRHVLEETRGLAAGITARIVETPRNIPVRNIYRDNGFVEREPGFWLRTLESQDSPLPDR
ncbi:MAG: HAD-IIIC family phosphatase [Beijerinckiaceae bacterium]|jgi:FkbH-like protein